MSNNKDKEIYKFGCVEIHRAPDGSYTALTDIGELLGLKSPADAAEELENLLLEALFDCRQLGNRFEVMEPSVNA